MRIVTSDPLANIEVAEIRRDSVRLAGWIVHRASPLTHVTLRLNSMPWGGEFPLHQRPDVRKSLCPGVRHTAGSGFDVVVPLERSNWREAVNRLEIVGRRDGENRGSITVGLRDLAGEMERFPVPPQILKLHVGRERDDFLSTGWRIYSDLKSELDRFGGWGAFDRVLDWGCGCGRVLRYLLEDVAAQRVSGCDIDREAIEWLTQVAKGSSFEVIQPGPPTPYPDGHFSIIYGISVFTHLSEEMQDMWLRELSRISTRDGLVAVTVHGPDLAVPRLRRRLKKRGFADIGSDHAAYFAPYAGGEYYRTAYHTPAYVEGHWSGYFDILAYVSRGINSHQDLVVMRRR